MGILPCHETVSNTLSWFMGYWKRQHNPGEYVNTAQLPVRPNGITRYHLLVMLFLLFSMPSLSTAAVPITFDASERTLEVDFSFDIPVDPARQLTGYRLYREGVQVCATNEPSLSRISCALLTKDGAFNFTLTAVYSDNTESEHSAAYPFVVSSPHSVNFAWTAVSGAENQGGFRIYDNGVLLTQVSDPSARQLTYTADYTTAAHTYTIVAVDGSGTEKPLTDALTYGEVYPPAAVLSSSTAAGNAPLAVRFDGSSSTATNLPLVSYDWTFGDGSRATGQSVSHDYTTPGTYTAQLTVKDSQGLTDTVTTPIVVGQATANQKPKAVISADQTKGLTVSFSGAQSTDPDGSIVKYEWNFGDGSTGSGSDAQHTYTRQGSYTVSLQVTDNNGATATATKQIQSGTALPLEAGQVDIDQEWAKVLFTGTFTNPVVVAGAPTTVNETDPVTVRIRNVTPEGFEIRLQEWDYLDGVHKPETVNYLVMEKGVHTLSNGGRIEAGTFSGGSAFARVALQQAYTAKPVILTQVVSLNKAEAVTGRIQNIGLQSFEYKLQEMEKTATAHQAETVSYIAWEPGKGEVSGLLYEVGITPANMSQNWFDIAFGSQFAEQPAFIAGMQTQAAIDTATVRSQNLSTTAAQIKIEEERSKDKEVNHGKEAVGYIAVGAAPAPAVQP